MTLAAIILDPVAHQITVVNAGHMNPKIYRACRAELSEAINNEQSGLPLGVMPGFEYEAVTLALEAGDTVTMFTDGVTDALNPAGEMFGPERVDKALCPEEATSDAARPQRIGEKLVSDVRKHANGRAQNDDIAIVCFGRIENGHGPKTSIARAAPHSTPIKVPM